jgi:putative selenium metabolism hydrolase
MTRAGLPEVRVDRIGNVIGRIGSGSGPTIMLEGHMDTVACGDPSRWRYGPYEAPVVDGTLYGLGAADMKGTLASMVYGAKALLDAGVDLRGSLYIVGVVQEEPCEGAAIGMLLEAEGIQPDFVLIGESTSLQVARGQRGRLELKVTAKGRSCHASAPARGRNAIYEAARIVVAVELMAPQMESDPFLGKASMAVTEITSSAFSRNAIPESCVLYFDRRLTGGETEARAVAEMRSLVNRDRLDATVEVTEYHARSYTGYEYQARQYFPCWTTPENSQWLRRLSGAVEHELGYRPRVGRWDFSTDGVYTAGVAGIPTAGFGPGDEKYVHTPDEQVSVASLLDAARVYARLGAEALSAGRTGSD